MMGYFFMDDFQIFSNTSNCETIFVEGKSDKSIAPPFGYFGSKHRIASKIAQMIPPHNAWVEGFCGSAAVTLAKAPCQIEIINDLDDQIVNLFKQLRDAPERLLELVELTPYARAEFDAARKPAINPSDLERARVFLVATMMTVNGSVGSEHAGFSFSDTYSRGAREARVNRWYQLPERIREVVERLRSVRVEKMDAVELVNRYADRPGTLIYLDPPYLMDRQHGYKEDANCSEFHERLLLACTSAKCMILISGYKNSLYTNFLQKKNGWTNKSMATKTRGTQGIDLDRTEMFWMNEVFTRASKNNRVPVSLSAKEKSLNKINPKRCMS
jgi:DNA adenine methylase